MYKGSLNKFLGELSFKILVIKESFGEFYNESIEKKNPKEFLK